jgi:hypothetical protein
MLSTKADFVFAVRLYGEPIHVEGQFTILDDREAHHEVLKGTLDFKLCLRGKNIALRGFCDADWAGDANDWQSTTRYMFLISDGIIM